MSHVLLLLLLFSLGLVSLAPLVHLFWIFVLAVVIVYLIEHKIIVFGLVFFIILVMFSSKRSKEPENLSEAPEDKERYEKMQKLREWCRRNKC